MFSHRVPSAALLFDVTLLGVVVSFGLMFDHLLQQSPTSVQPSFYAQQAGAQQAVAQALARPFRRPS